jgi:hypothetical protein
VSRLTGSRLFVVLLACLLLAPSLALGNAAGEPRLDATIGDNRVVAGEETTLQVTLTNAGDLEQASATNPSLNQQVLTASGVGVELEADGAPLSVTTARQRVGSVPGGGERVVPFAVSVDENAKPGTYDLEVDLEYSYASSITEPEGTVGQRTVDRSVEVRVRVVRQARFAVVDTAADVAPNGAGTVSVTLENVGTERARDATVALESLDSGVTLGSGATATATRFAGDWRPGETRTLTYAATAADATLAAEYPFRVTAAFDDDRGVRRTGDPRTVGIEPRADGQFAVTDVSSDAVAGGAGTVAVTLRNDGSAVADATLSLHSGGALSVEGGAATGRFVGDWPAGAERTVRFGVRARPGTEAGTYPLDASVDYRTAGGASAAVRGVTVGVEVAPAQAFSLRDVDASLAVGEEGTLAGAVVNEGPGPVRNAVVVVSSPSPNVRLAETTYAVGGLDAGASAAFAFDAAVAPAAEPGPRPFDVTVRYEGAGGEARESDPLRVGAEVAPQPERLALEALNATYGPDTSNRLAVRVTNVGDERLADVRLRLAAAPPFASESPSAFVPALAPGESATVGFELAVSEDAVASTHAVAVNASAETADGTPIRTGPSLLPVTVAEPDGPGGDLALVAAAAVFALVVLGAGWWWLRR